MSIVVTGADGFVGRHLAETLHRQGTAFVAWTLHGASVAGARSQRSVDLTDVAAIGAALEEDQPTRLVHLAALSDVGASVTSASRVWAVNTLATVNLAAQMGRVVPQCGLVFASSGDAYGATFNQHRPVDESHPLQPLNPYAASKAAAELALEQYQRSAGLPLLRVRSFNCAGPGQRTGFVVSDFAAQIAAAEAGQHPAVLKVGNLNASRDFIDVRDAAEAYAMLLKLPLDAFSGQALNLCSGDSRTVRSILDRMLALAGVPINVETDAARLRPSDVPIALGSPRAMTDLTGWTERRGFDQTLADTLDDWRQRVATRAG